MDEQPLLEHLIATGPTVIYRRTAEGIVTYVSPNVERILGYSPEHVVGDPDFWPSRVHPEDRERLVADERRAFERGSTELEREHRFLHRDGIYRWLRARTHIEYDEAGAPTMLLGCATDVTERKRSEDALRASERRIRLILDTAYEAFISIDMQGRIIDWNVESERLFGWTREEAIGRVLADTIVPERYRGAHIRGLEHYRATGEGSVLGQVLKLEGLRRNGSEFPIELTISPTRLDGTVVFNAFLRDITERKRTEDALHAARVEAERAREEAELASRAKSEFLARMSHELRTPLNSILGFAQLLEIDDLDPEHGESVDQIVRAGRHLLQLIDEVLDVARIEQGRPSVAIEPVQVRDVVREALDLVEPLAASASIPMRGDVSHFDGHALADPQRLKQVLMNLLSNALKYKREGGDVSLSCRSGAGGRVRIEVADTGPGIPTEEIDRVFMPFERLGAERTPIEGTGIGLSICKRLVDLMGGEIGAESQIGKGSTFWVELEPAEAPEKQPEPAAARAPEVPDSSGGSRTILYVEDNLANLRLVERILARRPDTKLIAAMQGGLALELAREHRPDLILLDVHLPDMDGDEVFRRLQADPETRDIQVVVVSAEATPGKIDRFLAAGARAYLTKPLDVQRFLEVVG